MRNETSRWPGWARMLVLAGILSTGLIGIIGSGGGGPGDCKNFITIGCMEFKPAVEAFVHPLRATVPVGGSVTFTVTTNAPNQSFSFQWKRSRDGGTNYVDIPGATSASLTISGAQLPEDGTLFFAEVTSPGTLVYGPFPPAYLFVSSMPGVEFADGEFQAADWSATAVAVPVANGPTNSGTQAVTGGNPGSFKRMTFEFPSGAGSLSVFDTSQTSIYDPALLGAIHTIDFSQDCSVVDSGVWIGTLRTFPSVEQAGRRYVSLAQSTCYGSSWRTPKWASLMASDLVQVDGPACGTGESCPDFSATGAPLQFGYVRQASQAESATAGVVVHGIDNWKVTVWRR